MLISARPRIALLLVPLLATMVAQRCFGAAKALTIAGPRCTTPLVLLFAMMQQCYGALTVTLMDTYNRPLTTASYVTISGLDFGTDEETPTAYFSGSQCYTASWTSSTTMWCDPSKTFAKPNGGATWVQVLAATSGQAFTFDCTQPPSFPSIHPPIHPFSVSRELKIVCLVQLRSHRVLSLGMDRGLGTHP